MLFDIYRYIHNYIILNNLYTLKCLICLYMVYYMLYNLYYYYGADDDDVVDGSGTG